MQAKLLLVLNDQSVQRLGSSRWTKVDMRVIAASNVPLKSLVAEGKMRTDFFYRVNVIPIRLIPLRQRLNDIPLLVQDFLRHHLVAIQKQITNISAKAMGQLMGYDWPGNVRELQNVRPWYDRSKVIDEVELSDIDVAQNKTTSEPSSFLSGSGTGETLPDGEIEAAGVESTLRQRVASVSPKNEITVWIKIFHKDIPRTNGDKHWWQVDAKLDRGPSDGLR